MKNENWKDTLINLIEKEQKECLQTKDTCYMNNILSFVDAEIERQKEKQRGQILTLITKEIVIAQREKTPTSRLTSLYNKIIKL